MRPPRLCLLCGHVPKGGEDVAAACASCGEAPPEVRWQSTQSYPPGQRARLIAVTAFVAVLMLALAAILVREAVRAPSLTGVRLMQIGVALVLVCATGLVLWIAEYTLFVRTYRFESADGRVTGDVSTFGDRVYTAFGMHYVLRPVDVPAAAVALSSASALAAGPAALRERVRAVGAERAWLALDDEMTLALAAILGMAARGEIEVLAGTARRFWIGTRPEAPKEVEDAIWVSPRGGAAAAQPFERRFREHLDAIVSERRGGAIGDAGPAAYRVGAARDEAPRVLLGDVVARFGMEIDRTDDDEGPSLRDLFAADAIEVDGDAVAAALVAAVSVDARAAQAIVYETAETLEAMR